MSDERSGEPAEESSESTCPACGQVNLCLQAQASSENIKSQAQQCWCMSVNLTESQRQAATKIGKGERCLCQNCLKQIQEAHQQ